MKALTSLVKTLIKPMKTFVSPMRPLNDSRNGLALKMRGIICKMMASDGQMAKSGYTGKGFSSTKPSMGVSIMAKHLNVNFKTYNQADLLAKAGHIVARLKDNAYFPEPWPAPLPPLETIEGLVSRYALAYQAALNGDRLKIAERNAISEELIQQLKKIAHYLEVIADGNEAILISSGYDVSHEPVHGKAKPEAAGPAG